LQVFEIRKRQSVGLKHRNTLFVAFGKKQKLDQKSFDFNVKPFAITNEVGKVVLINSDADIHY